MKLHVHVGPLPLEPPYFDGDEDEDEEDLIEDDDEIDLTDLLEQPPAEIVH